MTNLDKMKKLCKYGATCYQKNTEHLSKFSHDFSKPEEKKEKPPLIPVSNEETKNAVVTKDKSPEASSPPAKRVKSSTDEKKLMRLAMPDDFYALWQICEKFDQTKPLGLFPVLSHGFEIIQNL